MKGYRIVVPNVREVNWEEFEINEAEIVDDEILVKNKFTMISPGTELSIYTGIDPEVYIPTSWCHYPFYPGYIGIGEVIKKGPKVKRVEVGDLIYYFSRHTSISKIKGESPYNFYLKIPPEIDYKIVPLTRFATIALTSLRVSSVVSGDTVVVIGLGLVGNFAAQLFKIAGAKVIGVDLSNRRLELARQAGIELLINPSKSDMKEEVLKLTDGKEVDAVIDAVGDSRIVVESASLVKKMGEIILLGTPRAKYETDITPLLRMVHLNWVTLKGALEWCFPLYETVGSKFSYEKNSLYIFELIKDKKLSINGLITHIIKPENFKEAYEGLLNKKDEYLGVLIDWT